MNLEQVEYIVEVAKVKKISIAAQNLHVTQSGVSQSIKRLEEELGIKIFKRSKIGSVPTEKGKKIIKRANNIIMEMHEIKNEALLSDTIENGELNIEATPGFLMSILPRTLSDFKNDYPNVKIEIDEKGTHDIVWSVKEHKIDIGLVLTNKIKDSEEGIMLETLYEGRMQIYAGKNSPLAFKKSITPQELVSESFVIHKSDKMREFFSKYNIKNILFVTNNTEAMKKVVAEGLAVMYSADFTLKNDPYVLNGDIIPIPLANHESIRRTFGWARSTKKEMSATSKEFIKYLKKSCQGIMG